MIEGLLSRLYGCYSYEEGVKLIKLAEIKSTGGTTPSFRKIDVVSSTSNPVPILITLKNQKNTIPFESEKKFKFYFTYKNQYDVTHTGYCTINEYSEADLDYRAIMQVEGDFVKEITGVNTILDGNIGNLGDTVEIIGLVGNIAKLLSVFSVLISEALYYIRVSSVQKFVSMAFSSGLKLLALDYGLNLGDTYSDTELRILTRVFSSFVVPSKSEMNESMSTVYSVIDPDGSVEVEGDFVSPYKVIYTFHSSLLDFTEEMIALIVIFAERYRPVPATTEIIIEFEKGLEDEATITESATLEVTSDALYFSSGTLMGSSAILGSGNVSEVSLPTNYP